jgi:hypothetical protein
MSVSYERSQGTDQRAESFPYIDSPACFLSRGILLDSKENK